MAELSESAKEKHLEFVQAAISRMANNSFLIKGWSATVVLGTTLFAADRTDPGLALVGLLPAFVFWGLDAFYLRRERLFRHLHDKVRLGEATDYDMSTDHLGAQVDPWVQVLFSASVFALHGLVMAWVLGTAGYLWCTF